MIILLSILAHLIRDGLPPLGRTTYARLLGTILCVIGSLLTSYSWEGLVIGLAIGVGFWTDMKHGEGQQARNLKDAGWLLLSGVTSLLPLVIVSIYIDTMWITILLAALVKPIIWFSAWRIVTVSPTRLAAGWWGLIVGILAFSVLYHV